MRGVIYGLMVVLMVLWTAVLLVDLVQIVLASGLVGPQPATGEAAPMAVGDALSNVWGPAAQARAIVWGLPMIVFALIAAITQR